MFSDEDINKAMIDHRNNQEEGLDIEPFDKKSLTPVGYDIRVGSEGFSWKRKCVVDIVLLYEKNKTVSRFPRGIPTVFSEIEFSDYEDALIQLENVLKQWRRQQIK